MHIAQNRLGSLTEFRCGARGPSAIGGSDFSGPCITGLRLPAFYEGGTERVRIPVPPPASQQRTVPCSGSPLILMKGSAAIDGLSGSAKGEGLMVRISFSPPASLSPQ